MVTWSHIPLPGGKKRTFIVYAKIDNDASDGHLEIDTRFAQQFPNGLTYCHKNGPIIKVSLLLLAPLPSSAP